MQTDSGRKDGDGAARRDEPSERLRRRSDGSHLLPLTYSVKGGNVKS